jgi:hypothetical protein
VAEPEEYLGLLRVVAAFVALVICTIAVEVLFKRITEFSIARFLRSKIGQWVGAKSSRNMRKEIRATEAKNQWKEFSADTMKPEYAEWQGRFLQEEHQDFLGTITAKSKDTPCFPSVGNKQYPIVCYRSSKDICKMSNYQDIFGDKYEEANLRRVVINDDGTVSPENWPEIGKEEKKIRDSYSAMLQRAGLVRLWNLPGFALTELRFNESLEVISAQAELITYAQNCLTSHVLGYELYMHAPKEVTSRSKHGHDKNSKMSELRAQISLEEGQASPSEYSVVTPSNFHPLISVQALVIRQPTTDKDPWRVLVMQRSSDVAAAAGLWQFPPAGGFEVFGAQDLSKHAVGPQFSIKDALIREFFEEVFGDSDLTSESEEIASSALRGNKGHQAFENWLKNGAISLYFLGVVTEFVSLRSEFSFLIVIEKIDEISSLSYASSEKKTAQWLRGSGENSEFMELTFAEVQERLKNPEFPWNPSSFGLAKLFADLSSDRDSWLCTKYPEIPELTLDPAGEPE